MAVALRFFNSAVIHRSLNKADDCRSRAMAGKETKLEEGAISEILAADTNSESDAKASDVEGYFEEKEGGGGGMRRAEAAAGLSRS